MTLAPSLPLESNKITSQFKLFPADIGIVVTMFGTETLAAVSSGSDRSFALRDRGSEGVGDAAETDPESGAM